AFQLLESRIGERALIGVQPGALGKKDREPAWIPKRQRLEEERVGDAEDGGVGADRNRQGEDRDRGKSRASRQQPEGVCKIPHWMATNLHCTVSPERYPGRHATRSSAIPSA